MFRKAFVMSVDPDQHHEYKRRHDEIWPELEAVFRAHGLRRQTIGKAYLARLPRRNQQKSAQDRLALLSGQVHRPIQAADSDIVNASGEIEPHIVPVAALHEVLIALRFIVTAIG